MKRTVSLLITLVLFFSAEAQNWYYYKLSNLYDRDMNEVSQNSPLFRGNAGSVFCALESENYATGTMVTLSKNGQVVGTYQFVGVDNGWNVLTYSNYGYTNQNTYLLISEDYSTMRFSGMFDSGYVSEGTRISNEKYNALLPSMPRSQSPMPYSNSSNDPEKRTCSSCCGTGNCQGCGGTGENSYNKNGKCLVCRGNGRCVGCQGKGHF